MRFEWDEAKNHGNLKKHGIPFQLATEVFSDPFCLTIQDQMNRGEEGFLTIGRITKSTVVLVVHTLYDDEGNRDDQHDLSAKGHTEGAGIL